MKKKCIALQKEYLKKNTTPTTNCTGGNCNLEVNAKKYTIKIEKNSFANTISFFKDKLK